ncbi:hypothetical protein GCM10022396_40550 [Flavivirga amylovorans]
MAINQTIILQLLKRTIIGKIGLKSIIYRLEFYFLNKKIKKKMTLDMYQDVYFVTYYKTPTLKRWINA